MSRTILRPIHVADSAAATHPDSEAKPLHINVVGLAISYQGKEALYDVSMPIYKGCITALIGPSGCGKSSFLASLSRMTDLIPGCKVAGNIYLNNSDIHDRDVNVLGLRREVGMIFQKPNPFPLSIRANIAMPLKEHGYRNRSELADRVRSALDDVGLWKEVHDRMDMPALALSGGQQQRLCIARALALSPSVLLMDEPCSALDPISSRVIEELIQSLLPKYTIVIVTHNLAQARRISDYAGMFWNEGQAGTIIEFGHTEQLFKSPAKKLTADYISGARG